MKSALALAERGLGTVAPNPAVGCLIVKNGIVVGRGWTQPGGRPHAEAVALEQAGAAAKGATAYVTLEPCAHHGKTPPCAEALVKAGIARLVVAAGDTDPRVAGKGLQILQEAALDVTQGVLEDEAQRQNAGFFLKVGASRPFFTLKVATTIDGKIATSAGESKWITGNAARTFGHMLRATHDAILVGVNTVLADDPELGCRIAGLSQRSPVRIVLDSNLKTPATAQMLQGPRGADVWLIANAHTKGSAAASTLAKAGAKLFFVKDTRDLKSVAALLAGEGLTRVLVEGGGTIHASFLRSDLCDQLFSFTAAKVIGAEGIAGVGELSLALLENAPHLKLVSSRKIGTDLLATYRNAE
ncbi:MAG: bifunctional diaminohydroxyphosphoribosylaminopyrimidine deaminase/5-amino-6-(5-phosphoribosylamino)uracil reductase RibD [Kordiimonadaceae bacterium]|nr:bifunctional diaminohydroxyphosphoribosylaminopyrimidine deaminase/5-amino-6-(5-phosphoribosylamino)uracil reductase RibD [Kordiimonadaceae bacterium]